MSEHVLHFLLIFPVHEDEIVEVGLKLAQARLSGGGQMRVVSLHDSPQAIVEVIRLARKEIFVDAVRKPKGKHIYARPHGNKGFKMFIRERIKSIIIEFE